MNMLNKEGLVIFNCSSILGNYNRMCFILYTHLHPIQSIQHIIQYMFQVCTQGSYHFAFNTSFSCSYCFQSYFCRLFLQKTLNLSSKEAEDYDPK